MHTIISEHLRARQRKPIQVAIVGAGFIGKALARRISRIPGLKLALIVNRTLAGALEAWKLAGSDSGQVLVSDHPDTLSGAIQAGCPATSCEAGIAGSMESIDVVVETTSSIDTGILEALSCIHHKKDFVTFSAEMDATVGWLLKAKADQAASGYAVGHGDQPATLWRLLEEVRHTGFVPMLAMNCKGFLDVKATPDSILEWSSKQGTSPRMTSAFTDGTKMQIEQNVVANASGFLPIHRGMTGVKTDLPHALLDLEKAGVLAATSCVDYTLGGDFGGGVFVVGRAEDPGVDAHYLRYLKMGNGPHYLFHKPWHLCHLELALSVAEMAIFHRTGIAPAGAPVARTVTLAKRSLKAGERLDGIGGFMTYGELDREQNALDLLPIGLSEGATLTRDIPEGHPVPLDAVELDGTRPAVLLWGQNLLLS
jgi:predicted homoserine dehydrogenase-like protein